MSISHSIKFERSISQESSVLQNIFHLLISQRIKECLRGIKQKFKSELRISFTEYIKYHMIYALEITFYIKKNIDQFFKVCFWILSVVDFISLN